MSEYLSAERLGDKQRTGCHRETKREVRVLSTANRVRMKRFRSCVAVARGQLCCLLFSCVPSQQKSSLARHKTAPV